jgi:7,8-dihydroneopterin aldolase/epimerase/oxygenase
MDRIEIVGLRAFGRHGVTPEEQRSGQEFVVDLTLELDLSAAASSDRLGDTVDYATLAQQVCELVEQTRFDLIEALAARIADLALTDPAVAAAEVRVAKPQAPLTVEAREVAVTLHRSR